MTDLRCATYSRYLATIDRRLFVEADAHSRDPRRRAYWVKYRLSTHKPIKLAAISEFPEFTSGPGEWLLGVLHRLDWHDMVVSAKVAFAHRYDMRRLIGLDKAVSLVPR